MRMSSVCLVLLCAALLSCGPSPGTSDSFETAIESYGALDGLKNSHDVRLREAWAQLVEEKATPELLMHPEVPEEDNVAAGLRDLFDEQKVEQIDAEIQNLMPEDRFEFTAIQLEKAIRQRRVYQRQRDAVRTALARSACNFGVDYRQGIFDPLSFLPVVRICVRLEAFAAAEALFGHQAPADAVAPLGTMFRLVHRLAAERNMTTRRHAAQLRAETLAVVAAVAQHPKATRDELDAVVGMLEAELRDWPPDAQACIGDRAIGLHYYETIRAGGLLSVVSDDDLKELVSSGDVSLLASSVLRFLDDDEAFYLDTMGRTIDECKHPYYRRIALFDDVGRKLRASEGTEQYPTIAGRLLLATMRNDHWILARDRAACEAWTLALEMAAGRPQSRQFVNPLTGQPYSVVVGKRTIEVGEPDPKDGKLLPLAKAVLVETRGE